MNVANAMISYKDPSFADGIQGGNIVLKECEAIVSNGAHVPMHAT